jgi:hypothetical protein
MNDFSDVENELKKLRPAPPSPVLIEQVEQALQSYGTDASSDKRPVWLRSNWWSLGFGLAAATVLVLFAIVTMERQHDQRESIAQTSHGSAVPMPPGSFVPAGGTNVVYNARDEGLHFADGSQRPVRRVRYHTQQTWRWRNPETGASLRVSYPSEEIVLMPVSGQ